MLSRGCQPVVLVGTHRTIHLPRRVPRFGIVCSPGDVRARAGYLAVSHGVEFPERGENSGRGACVRVRGCRPMRPHRTCRVMVPSSSPDLVFLLRKIEHRFPPPSAFFCFYWVSSNGLARMCIYLMSLSDALFLVACIRWLFQWGHPAT